MPLRKRFSDVFYIQFIKEIMEFFQSFNIYQWIALIFGILMIAKSWSSYLYGNKSIKELVAWHVIFGGMVVLAIYPELVVKRVADATGFESGVNAIVALCLAILFYLVFRLVNIVETLERKLTELVREIALRDSKKE